jgi:hypothetical protein
MMMSNLLPAFCKCQLEAVLLVKSGLRSMIACKLNSIH